MQLLMNFFSHFVQDIKEYLESSVEENYFIFDLIKLMYYKCYKVNFRVIVQILILQTR